MSLSPPLFEQDESLDKADAGQLRLREIGANALNSIEDGTKVFDTIKNKTKALERIFEALLTETESDFVFVGSMNDYQVTRGSYDRAVLHISLQLGEEVGGHYGVIIKDMDKVTIFDSMTNNSTGGYYGEEWAKVARNAFEGAYTIVFPAFTPESCLQTTGGTLPRKPTNVQLQDENSQDHFCYMWSILYFHLYLLNQTDRLYELTTPARKLGTIKKYAWAWFNRIFPDLSKPITKAYPKTSKEQRKILLTSTNNFRYIWSSMGSKCNLGLLFRVIPSHAPPKRVPDILEYALEEPTFIYTPSPPS